MSNANGMNGGFADPAAVGNEAVPGWASNDAFASGFDDNKSPVSTTVFSGNLVGKFNFWYSKTM